MIWETFYVEVQRGHVTPLPLPGGAHGDTHSNTLYSRAVMVDSWHSGGVVSVA